MQIFSASNFDFEYGLFGCNSSSSAQGKFLGAPYTDADDENINFST